MKVIYTIYCTRKATQYDTETFSDGALCTAKAKTEVEKSSWSVIKLSNSQASIDLSIIL